MEKMNLIKKQSTVYDRETLLQSSPNILENFSYDNDDNNLNKSIKIQGIIKPLMENSPKLDNHLYQHKYKQQNEKRLRSNSPKFSEAIEKNLFMKNVINMKPTLSSSSSTSSSSSSSSLSLISSPSVSLLSSPQSSSYHSVSTITRKQGFHNDKETILRRSLEEISKDIKEIEDFLTVSENIIRKEREKDNELYIREKRRKQLENDKKNKHKNNNSKSFTSSINESPSNNKENKTPTLLNKINSPNNRRNNNNNNNSSSDHLVSGHKPLSPPTFKINSYKRKKPIAKFSTSSSTSSTPSTFGQRFSNSRLYFRNGKIGCVEAEQNSQLSNIESTHALIKHILKYEKEKPLVSPGSVRKVLNEYKNENLNESENNQNEIKDTDSTEIQNKNEIKNLKIEIPDEMMNENSNEKNDNNQNDLILIDLEEHPENCTESFAPKLSESISESSTRDNKNQNESKESEKNDADIQSNASSDQLKTLDSDSEQFVRNQVRHLVRRFTARTSKMRTRLELPPTPSSSASSPSPPLPTAPTSIPTPPTSPNNHQLNINRLNSFQQSKLMMNETLMQAKGSPLETSEISSPTGKIRKIIDDDGIDILDNGSIGLPKQQKHQQQKHQEQNYFEADHQSINNSGALLCAGLCGTSKNEGILDPQGKIYISWLCIVSLSFLYNAWVIPLRSAFPFQNENNTNIWLTVDFCADLIYLLDVIFFKHRVMYLFEGFWVKDKHLTRKNYMRKLQFKLDLLSLIPLDLLYFKYGTNAVYLRFPRLLKIQSFWEVFKLLDRVISSPHFVRVAKTLTYMLYMIHLTACAYYAYSAYQGLGTNRWVFNGKGHPYVRCFAFATKTATSIGKNPKPEKEGELLFMTAAWLMGVFVFALLIGQIRDIISTATRSQSEYRQLEDETLEYMRRLNLPNEIQRRVKMWFKFTWDQQRTLDERHILDSLPANLKTDIAISVHIQTLSKVQLFADYEEALLRELVLKLRSVTFLPGDYVCRKGEVGKEMYIVKLGQVQVMGGINNDEVLATLSEGSVFGEISLLAINGEQGNRRTADVKSKGFSNLFVLSKNDLNEAIAYYPYAQAILKKRARSLIRKNAAREREEKRKNDMIMNPDVVIGNPQTPETPPKLLKTVIQALPDESPAVVLLTRGSKKLRKKQKQENEENLLKITCNGDKNRLENEEIDNINRSESPDLLSSIQDELKNKNKLINLTDSEKALIMSTSSLNSSNSDNENCN